MSDTATSARVVAYEGMFLFPQSASADLGGTVAHVREILERNGAEILSLVKWDERRLAYDIRGNKRGLYLLAYFRAATTALSEIERSCNLSEQLLRHMVLRADHVHAEAMRNEEGVQRLADEIALRAADRDADQRSAREAPAETASGGEAGESPDN
jgi:small subunit ribosomal protein S6